MKKNIAFGAVLVLWSGLAWGQYGYQYMSGGYMFGVQFVGQEGWMVGANGTIQHSLDGGKSWVFQRNIENYNASNPPIFGQVLFKNPSFGWLCDRAGSRYFWRTTDGGQFWKAETSLSSCYPNRISFVDTLCGWVSGVGIGATADGGRTWTIQFQSPRFYYDICAVTPRHCRVVGGNYAVRTTDGGQNWVEQQLNTSWFLDGVFFTDTLYGWACGWPQLIAHTTDGGLNWAQQTSGGSKFLSSLTFLDRGRGFAVGDSGTFLKTTDGGATWDSVSTGVVGSLTDISFSDSIHGWIIGDGGTTLETSDGGTTWSLTRQGSTERLQALSFADDSTGWAASWEGNLWHTVDGGRIWSRQDSVGSKPMLGLTMVNANTGWAVGDSGLVLATTNGGTTWTTQTSGTQRALWNVFASDAQNVWACGYGQKVIGTTDGGQTWNEQYRGDSSGFASAGEARPSRAGLVCGNNGLLLRTTDGSSWTRVTGPTTNNLWGLSWGDDQTAWVVGWKGMRLNTTDQGLSWQVQKQDSLLDSLLLSVQAYDGLTARVTGYLGRSVLTTDGGITWIGEDSGTDEWLLASSFRSPTLGWVAGENGMVLKYGLLPSGVKGEKEGTAIPWVTNLGQNRPNPFVRETEIKYQLASKEKIRLVVYNVLGQAVRRLVNGEQSPGSYLIRWDGKDEAGRIVPTGVYFCRLEALENSVTRKMVKVR